MRTSSSTESPTVRIPTIRACDPTDVPAITAIYAHYVLNSSGTFEESPPSLTEMENRRQQVLDEEMPYLVAELSGTVFGFAYATIYRHRTPPTAVLYAGAAVLVLGALVFDLWWDPAAGSTTTKLFDFGIMSFLDGGCGETAGRFFGTLRYAAPEQLFGEKAAPLAGSMG